MEVIVGALITGLFTLLAAFIPPSMPVTAESIPPSMPVTAKKKWGPALRKRRTQILLGISIAVVACAVMAGYLSQVITRPPQATITAPGPSATAAVITAQSTIQGSASDLPHDQLFIMLRSTGGGLQYYPEAQVSDWTGANWRAALDAPPGPGSYDLVAVAATTSEASGELRMYIELCQAAACPGVNPIPEGVQTLFSEPVIIP